MKYIRFNEPRDPELRRISKVLPDRWLDERWPQHSSKRQGRWKALRTSQFIRVHFLTLIKGLGSFNKVCRELEYNIDFRRFCRLRATDPTPNAKLLNSFRKSFGLKGWVSLHIEVLEILSCLYPPTQPGIALVDATDLPAAVNRSGKKKNKINACGT